MDMLLKGLLGDDGPDLHVKVLPADPPLRLLQNINDLAVQMRQTVKIASSLHLLYLPPLLGQLLPAGLQLLVLNTAGDLMPLSRWCLFVCIERREDCHSLFCAVENGLPSVDALFPLDQEASVQEFIFEFCHSLPHYPPCVRKHICLPVLFLCATRDATHEIVFCDQHLLCRRVELLSSGAVKGNLESAIPSF